MESKQYKSMATVATCSSAKEVAMPNFSAPRLGFNSDNQADLDQERLLTNKALIEEGVRLILRGLGEDSTRAGLLDTPSRVARMMVELTAGQDTDPASQITCEFQEDSAGLVLVKDITFSSTCEHHMLPFHGLVHIAYLPREGRITGLSKLARVVDVASKKLQVQERLTAQIADALISKLDPLGVFVLIAAEHSCMALRGVKKPGSQTITTTAHGCYQEDALLRAELLTLIQK